MRYLNNTDHQLGSISITYTSFVDRYNFQEVHLIKTNNKILYVQLATKQSGSRHRGSFLSFFVYRQTTSMNFVGTFALEASFCLHHMRYHVRLLGLENHCKVKYLKYLPSNMLFYRYEIYLFTMEPSSQTAFKCSLT